MSGEVKTEGEAKVPFTFYMTEDLRRLLELLAKYLYLEGFIEKPELSEALRYCIRFTATAVSEYIKSKGE